MQQADDILLNSGQPIAPANDLGDVAQKFVEEVRKAA
jgi:succinyl-CoA synthetase beta subunit